MSVVPDKPLHILISNDDGVYAPGLRALANALRSLAKITVVAPLYDQSGASHSLTLSTPLRVRETEQGYMAVNGTPTDCVHLALTGLLDDLPDMVVSGINAGANLGDDTLYSGTVAAAIEGRSLGLPAVAVSMVANRANHYQTGAYVASRIVLQLLESPLPSDTILNVNVPDVPIKALRGFEATRLGHRHRAEGMLRDTCPRGHDIFWIGPAGKEQDAGPGTDFFALHRGCVSLTPLQVDLTRHQALEQLRAWVGDLSV